MRVSVEVLDIVPQPQGSMRSNGYGALYYSNAAKLKPYRAAIAKAVREELPDDHVPWDGPITVRAEFVFERPKSQLRVNGELKANAPAEKLSAPDLDKLLRAVNDALTESGVYGDDAQITALAGSKTYGPKPVTRIEVISGAVPT